MPVPAPEIHSLPVKLQRSWTDPLMSSEYLRVALEVAEEKGIDPAGLLALSGLQPEQLNDLDARVSHLAYVVVVVRLAELSQDFGVGFEIGLRLGPTAHGAFGHAIMCCENLQQALDLFNQYGLTRIVGMRLRTQKQGQLIVGTLEREWEIVDAYTKIFLEGLVGGIYRSVQILTGDAEPPVQIHLMHDEPDYFARFRKRIPCIRFGQPAISFRMPAELLQRRLIMPSPVGLKLALLRCEEDLAQISSTLSHWTMRVQNLLRPGSHGYPSLFEIAERLSVSDRILRRRLVAEGSRFKEMLQESRRRDALTLLGNRAFSIEQIATRLGYLNPANFTRAFVAWAGQSPTAYRKSCHKEAQS